MWWYTNRTKTTTKTVFDLLFAINFQACPFSPVVLVTARTCHAPLLSSADLAVRVCCWRRGMNFWLLLIWFGSRWSSVERTCVVCQSGSCAIRDPWLNGGVEAWHDESAACAPCIVCRFECFEGFVFICCNLTERCLGVVPSFLKKWTEKSHVGVDSNFQNTDRNNSQK
jgi:hypothetical protein